MTKQERQIRDHVGDRAAERAAAFSFCYGRGWRAHRTVHAAERARARDVRAFVAAYGGGEPQNFVRGPLVDAGFGLVEVERG